MSQALYRKWRPQNWGGVVGQEHVTQTLQNAIQGGRIGHAYLFSGPRGTGKTSTARLLAKAVNCMDEKLENRPCNACEICQAINAGRFLDLIEIDAASNTSVDDVRDLRDKINFSPSQGRYKVYIIDEVHMLSTAAFNALLKTLEEPPPHAIFILATTEIHKIPATVLSRCQRHEFRRISVNDIVAQLEDIVKEEQLSAEPAALTLIARQSTGALRDAISLLDQLSSTGSTITLDLAQKVLGTATNQTVIQLVDTILDRQTSEGLQTIHQALDSGTDSRQFARQIVEYLRILLLVQMGNNTSYSGSEDIKTQIEGHVSRFNRENLLFCLQRFNSTASDNRSNWQPNLPLELALAECIAFDRADPQAPLRDIKPAAVTVITPMASSPTMSSPTVTSPPARLEKISIPALGKPEKKPQFEDAPATAIEKTVKKDSGENRGDKNRTPPPVPSTDVSEKLSPKNIRAIWDEIRREVKNQKPPTEALLNSCKSISVRNSEVIFGFASDVVKSKMETNENLAIVRQIISRLLGIEVNIRCIVVSKKSTTSTTGGEMEGDGMVNAALGLGGQIIQKE